MKSLPPNLMVVQKEMSSGERFVVIDKNTQDVVDDSNGCGYKDAQKAYKSIWYKTNREEIESRKNLCKKFIRENKEFDKNLIEMMFISAKDGEKVTAEDVESLVSSMGLELPVPAKDFLKIYKNL